ncbi:Transcription factor bHLH61 [Senna tora]|uniref:Transcription factor bHLH61 n=1 Tax=Senna tora TaxID=362788 RepID=A0A834WR51_9FABA|nr:Transcription factor bHLH61 [Senna tora]
MVGWQINKASIIMDATKYIEELKQKVERLNQDVATTSNDQNPLPMVRVERVEKGMVINVNSGKSCPGLLVPLLEAFDEMGLTVMEARDDEEGESIDAEAVREAVGRAIKNWRESSDHQM